MQRRALIQVRFTLRDYIMEYAAGGEVLAVADGVVFTDFEKTVSYFITPSKSLHCSKF